MSIPIAGLHKMSCRGNCPADTCQWCDMSADKKIEWRNAEQIREYDYKTDLEMFLTGKSAAQREFEVNAELKRHYQYFISIGETPDQARKSARIEYLMWL